MRVKILALAEASCQDAQTEKKIILIRNHHHLPPVWIFFFKKEKRYFLKRERTPKHAAPNIGPPQGSG